MNGFRTIAKGRGALVAATERGREVLLELGLESLDAVREFAGGTVVTAGRHRVTRRLETRDFGVVYLKQSFRGGSGEMLRRFLRGGGRRSASCIELENAQRLQTAGINVPEPLAYGERIVFLREGFSFLLSSEMEGVTAAHYLSGRAATLPRSAERDTKIREALAGLLRKLDAAGLYYVDLVPKHIYLQETGAELGLSLIDVARVDRRQPHDEESFRSMLARLGAELPRHAVGIATRRRFVRDLTPSKHPELADDVDRRMVELFRKRRHLRHNLMRIAPIRPEPVWRKSADASLTVDTEYGGALASIGIDGCAPSSVAELERALATRPSWTLLRDTPGAVLRLANAAYYLSCWTESCTIVAFGVPEDADGASWAIRDDTDWVGLASALAAERFQVSASMADDLARLLQAVATTGYRPEGPCASWVGSRNGTICLRPQVPVPNDQGSSRRPTAADFALELARELEAAEVDKRRIESLLAACNVGQRIER